jgi:hypothetical protein
MSLTALSRILNSQFEIDDSLALEECDENIIRVSEEKPVHIESIISQISSDCHSVGVSGMLFASLAMHGTLTSKIHS